MIAANRAQDASGNWIDFACTECAADSATFVPYCGGCVVRRTARLTPRGRAAVVAVVRANDGDRAAMEFERRVAAFGTERI